MYGGLYQWDELMQYIIIEGAQGICADGWHIPADEEWKVLEGEVDSLYNYPHPTWNFTGWRGYDVGLNLKSTSGWDSWGNGYDLYGFSVFPAGSYRYGNFDNLGSHADFWTSSNVNQAGSWSRELRYSHQASYRDSSDKLFGFSVRCVKD